MKSADKTGTGALFVTNNSPEVFRGVIYHNGERVTFHAYRNPEKLWNVPTDPDWLLTVDKAVKVEL